MESKSETLNCDVCLRQHHAQRLPFLCAVDGRNALYANRIANARVLMEMDELEKRVNELLLGSNPTSESTAPDRQSRAYVENCHSETQMAQDRTEQIIAAADKLREEVDNAKREIEERKAAMALRKSDMASASQGITARRSRELEETKKSIKMTKYTWDREYEAMTTYRAALCTEVAKLYRLQRLKRGNPIRYEYKIGGIDVVDLHHLNSESILCWQSIIPC